MKQKLLIVLILVVIFVIGVFVRFFIMDRQNAAGQLRILSSPAASVFIDDVAVGKTPYKGNNVEVGEYAVKLIPDKNDENTVSWEGTVSVHKNTLTYVSRALGSSELTSAGETLTVVKMDKNPNGSTGEVAIETEPTGAIVYLDNDEKGVAPIILKDVPVGDHELAVYLPGFFRRSQKIQVEKGYQVQATFKLALDQSHRTLEEELEDAREEASNEAKLESASAEASVGEAEGADTETSTKETTESLVEVLDNEVGYLNVRDEPSVNGTQVTRINPGEQYKYTDQQNGWYQIVLDDGTEGWVSGDYVSEVE